MTITHQINRHAWDRMVAERQPFTRPALDAAFSNPLGALDIAAWLPRSLTNLRVLCLAAAGGRQGPLFACAGADVTVVDLSPAMLALDRQVAAERGLNLQTIEASMDDLSILAGRQFELVYQPVSTCYVPSLIKVYRQVATLLVSGGLYISQHKQPASLQASIDPNTAGRYELVEPYYKRGPLRDVPPCALREQGTHEFLHRWEEMIGGLCRCGFVIEDLIEPFHADNSAETGDFGHRCQFLAPYVRMKARRIGRAAQPETLWLPGG